MRGMLDARFWMLDAGYSFAPLGMFDARLPPGGLRMICCSSTEHQASHIEQGVMALKILRLALRSGRLRAGWERQKRNLMILERLNA